MRYLIIILAITVISACKKEQVVESQPQYATILPLSYFPTFPGSYWTYEDTFGDTTHFTTSPDYILDAYFTSYGVLSDSAYVPYYNGQAIWWYSYDINFAQYQGGFSSLERMLSDSLVTGSTWTISSQANTKIHRQIKNSDTTVEINGIFYSPTIVVDELYEVSSLFTQMTDRRFYTKDIGLIKHEKYDLNPGSPLNISNTTVIVDYYINN